MTTTLEVTRVREPRPPTCGVSGTGTWVFSKSAFGSTRGVSAGGVNMQIPRPSPCRDTQNLSEQEPAF